MKIETEKLAKRENLKMGIQGILAKGLGKDISISESITKEIIWSVYTNNIEDLALAKNYFSERGLDQGFIEEIHEIVDVMLATGVDRSLFEDVYQELFGKRPAQHGYL